MSDALHDEEAHVRQSEQDFGEERPMPVVTQPEPEKELYSWKAPSRPYKKRSREFYSTVGALVILLSVILMFAKEFLLIGVIVAFGFVAYALASVKPELITHLITNKGVRTLEKLHPWTWMGQFWWEEKWKQHVLHIRVPGQFPGELIMVLGEGEKERIDQIMSKYLIKQKPEPTWFDKAAKWLQEKVPLESDDEVRHSPVRHEQK
jgi:hypothetical protein